MVGSGFAQASCPPASQTIKKGLEGPRHTAFHSDGSAVPGGAPGYDDNVDEVVDNKVAHFTANVPKGCAGYTGRICGRQRCFDANKPVSTVWKGAEGPVASARNVKVQRLS